MPINPYEPPKEDSQGSGWLALKLIGITAAIYLAFFAVFMFVIHYLTPPASD